jgi:hypothetical protein
VVDLQITNSLVHRICKPVAGFYAKNPVGSEKITRQPLMANYAYQQKVITS